MSQEESQDAGRTRQAGSPFLLYLVCLAIVTATLSAEFFVSFNLLRDHPSHAPGVIREVYAAFAVGLLALAVQAVLVHACLLRPLREARQEVAQLNKALDQRSHRDPLTGALNRTAFEHMVLRELESLRRYGLGLCGIMLDVDGFRLVNERLGYELGDQVLVELAQLLKQHVRKADFVFRWRSGKFLILASGIDEDQALRFSAKLGQVLAKHDFRQGVQLSASLGVAQAQAEDTPELFVARIKTALSQAKAAQAAGRAEAAPAA